MRRAMTSAAWRTVAVALGIMTGAAAVVAGMIVLLCVADAEGIPL